MLLKSGKLVDLESLRAHTIETCQIGLVEPRSIMSRGQNNMMIHGKHYCVECDENMLEADVSAGPEYAKEISSGYPDLRVREVTVI